MTGPRWNLVRLAFLAAVLGGAWWSWRDSGEEVGRALEQMEAPSLVLASGLVLAGLACTGWVWQAALGGFGLEVRAREAVPLFFLGQLGKYIPGSVWSFAAQAALGRRHGLPPKASAAAAVLFLGVHVASGLLLVGLLGWSSQLPAWVVALSLVVATVGLVPRIYRVLGGRLAGQPCGWTWRRTAVATSLMLPAWTCYGGAVLVLAPQSDVSASLTLALAFAVAHAVGAAIPIAPAGLGAREAVLVALIAPVVGVGEATVVALVLRLLHAGADFLVAGVSWVVLRVLGGGNVPDPPAAPH